MVAPRQVSPLLLTLPCCWAGLLQAAASSSSSVPSSMASSFASTLHHLSRRCLSSFRATRTTSFITTRPPPRSPRPQHGQPHYLPIRRCLSTARLRAGEGEWPSANSTVSSALEWAKKLLSSHEIPDASLSAEYLLLHVLRMPPTPRSALTTIASTAVPPQALRDFVSLCERRLAREPLQYLVGNWDFHRITVDVRPPILIPRPETEELVELILSWKGVDPQAALRILDIGVGSGAIGLALLKALPRAFCVGIDPNPLAVDLARANARKLGLQARYECIHVGIEEYERGEVGFDCIVSNPPYIPKRQVDELQEEVRRYEDRGALDGGDDGGDIIRAILRRASDLLKEKEERDGALGMVWMEVDESHPEVMDSWLREGGIGKMQMVEWRRDSSGRPRFVCLRKTD